MTYKIIKFIFDTGVHFGNGSLDASENSFMADTFFSALCIEAIKHSEANLAMIVKAFTDNRLVISDAFPYIGDGYYIPKPNLYIKNASDKGDSVSKKKYKNLKYINTSLIDCFLQGNYPDEAFSDMDNLGIFDERTCVSVRGEEQSEPYRIGLYRFNDKSGLYVIVGYDDAGLFEELLDLITGLEASGLGGKRNSGLGRFKCSVQDIPDGLYARLEGKYERYMSLSCCLPKDIELEEALTEADYRIVKRSGFIQSYTYGNEHTKKKDIYLFRAGSCFSTKFMGDIYDVSRHGKHPIYRYAKGFFLGI